MKKRKVFIGNELKYVVVEFYDSDGKGGDMLVTCRCPLGTDRYYHSQSVRDAKGEGWDISRVMGGGRIAVDHKNKEIKVFGSSGSYGRANGRKVEALAREAMEKEGLSDYELVIE